MHLDGKSSRRVIYCNPPRGVMWSRLITSLIAREKLFFFFGIVDSVLEKGVMAYRENTKGAMDMIFEVILLYIILLSFVCSVSFFTAMLGLNNTPWSLVNLILLTTIS